jgi:hypothetical protein
MSAFNFVNVAPNDTSIVPIISQTNNVAVAKALASSSQVNFFSIASSNFNTSNSYRFTHNGYISPAVTVAGFLNCKILLSNATDGAIVVGGQAIPAAVANANIFVSMTSEFIPRSGDLLYLTLENNTVTSTTFNWTLTNRGNALEVVSSNNTVSSSLYTSL